MLRAIEMRTKNHAVIGNFAKIGKAKDLKAAGIGKNRSGPGHKTMQSAQTANPFVTRTKIKMISIAEQNLYAEFAERLLRQPLHRSRRADGHERRRIDDAVRSGETPQTRAGR